jgi:predicted membrane protein
MIFESLLRFLEIVLFFLPILLVGYDWNLYTDYVKSLVTVDESLIVYDFVIGKKIHVGFIQSGTLNWFRKFRSHPYFDNFENFVNEVGAGSAGFDRRLLKNNKVLLIEAGGDPLWHNSIPAFAADMPNNPNVDWMHKTVRQELSSFGLKDGRNSLPRGKSLGGSSNLNYMVYVRGSPHDYDNWANLTSDVT